MRILILQASPNLKGSTAILADEFARGAREAGHTVERVDVAHAGERVSAQGLRARSEHVSQVDA